MQAERWKLVEGWYHAALAQPPEERAEFLTVACADDFELRAEVQSLLDQQADSFLESAPLSAVHALTAGAKLGNFKIVALLGRGGMGEVWRARDPRLKRDVAIKVLPVALARDPDRIARFEREARAASALNHPNIVSVFDIGRDNGTYWIASELVSGDTLRRRIEGGPLSVAKAVEIATQVADGLAAAHAGRLVHRDLKPDNIMVTRDGRVKILDFGLAKRRQVGGDSTTLDLSREDTIMGTAGYMSPEQVRGEEVDQRSDLFSFGVIFYEMLAGQRAFSGNSSVELMSAILKDDPAKLPSAVPPALSRVVHRCLEKDLERRFQSAADLAFALASFSASLSAGPISAAPPSRKPWMKWAAIAAAAVTAIGTAYWLGIKPRGALTTPGTALRRLTADSGLTTDAAISPDGRLVAYASDRADPSNLDIWVQSIDGGTAVRLTNDPADDYDPSFSPDGLRIVFRSEREGGGIYEVQTLGGEARLLIPKGRRPRFSPDGRFLLHSEGIGVRGSPWNSAWFVQPVSGAGARVEISHGCDHVPAAVWSPDSRSVLFQGRCNEGGDILWLGSVDGQTRTETNLNEFWRTDHVHSPSPDRPYWPSFDEWAVYPPRLLLPIAAADAIYIGALPISADGMRATGPIERLTFGPSADVRVSASATGRMVLSSTTKQSHIWSLPIDENGNATGEARQLTSESLAERRPVLSKDGKYLAFLSDQAGLSELYCMNLTTGGRRLLSPEPDEIYTPVFNNEGTAITYTTNSRTVRQVALSGGLPEKIWQQEGLANPFLWDWSPDGRYLLFDAGKKLTRSSPKYVAMLNRQTLEITQILADPGRHVFRSRLSRDGQWVTFTATRYDNRQQIYVAPFRKALVPMSEWIPATDGSTWDDNPLFSKDGGLLFFTSNRDGFHCIWARRLTSDMHPSGSPFAVYHSHQSRRSLGNCGLNDELQIAVGPKMIAFAQVGFTGNVWLVEPGKWNRP